MEINNKEFIKKSTRDKIEALEKHYGKSLKDILIELNKVNNMMLKEIKDAFNEVYEEQGLPVNKGVEPLRNLFKIAGLEVHKGNPRVKQARADKIKKTTQTLSQDSKYREKRSRQVSEQMRKRWADEENRKRQSEIIKQKWENSDTYEPTVLAHRERMNDEEHLAHLAKINREKWQEEDYRRESLVNLKKAQAAAGFGNETRIERFVREVLEELEVEFEQEKDLKHIRCVADFWIAGKIIEVQGDYWHANPSKYNYNNLTKEQERGVERDKRKHSSYVKNGYEVLYIWESDIKERPDHCRELIKRFVK